MHEIIVNLHMHTVYSDGTGLHQDIATAALNTNSDVVIVTDHNVLVKDRERYYKEGKKRVLMLIGEEIHNQARLPQKSHLLVFNAGRELATLAENPQNLIDAVRQNGGLSFIAHPHETAAPAINETAITWEDWDVEGYTGIELWNGLSEIKDHIRVYLDAVLMVFFPHLVGVAPRKETLKKWDELLACGKHVVAIGGSDAHALKYHLGPITRTVLPYEFHFKTINTHIITPEPLSGDLQADKKMVYEALGAGHCFVAYDLPADTKGFRFSAQGKDGTAWMGDEISAENGVTLKIKLPVAAECHLIRDGSVIKVWTGIEACTYITTEPGVYRVEVFKNYLFKKRGWIYSNPIYVR